MASSESDQSDIELYCSSASLSENDRSEESDDEVEVAPYQFEPLRREIEELNREDNDTNPDPEDFDQTQNIDWCQCGSCTLMPTERECRCCMEIEAVRHKVVVLEEETGTQIRCVTAHPGFKPVCLNRYVLETAYLQYRQQYGGIVAVGIHEQRRYVAYRQLARWCWGYLGKEVRVVLPSCAVSKIRETYPAAEYRGFQDA